MRVRRARAWLATGLMIATGCSTGPGQQIVEQAPGSGVQQGGPETEPDPMIYPCLVDPTPSDCSAFEVEASRKTFEAGGPQAEIPDGAAPVDLGAATDRVLAGPGVVRADEVLTASCAWADLDPRMPGATPRYDVEPEALVHVVTVLGEIQRLRGAGPDQMYKWLVVTVDASTGQTLSIDAGSMSPPDWSLAPCTR